MFASWPIKLSVVLSLSKLLLFGPLTRNTYLKCKNEFKIGLVTPFQTIAAISPV